MKVGIPLPHLITGLLVGKVLKREGGQFVDVYTNLSLELLTNNQRQSMSTKLVHA